MKLKTNFWENRISYLIILPAFSLFAIFRIYPMLKSFYLSFFKFNITTENNFIGFQNYINIFTDNIFLNSIKVTFIFTLISVPLIIVISLALAMILDHPKLKGRNFFKALIFMPYITSGVVVSIIWKWFFNNRFGLINHIINIFGIESVNWLGSSKTALLCVITVMIWKFSGFFMLIFYGNLTMIDKNLYEAADVDGANGLQKFIYITLNQLRPAFSISILLATIYFFRAFEVVYNMTGGDPGGATNVLSYQIFTTAFRNLNFGPAFSGTMLMFIIAGILLIFQLLISEGKRYE